VKQMVIYEVAAQMDAPTFYATQKEAVVEAKALTKDPFGKDTEVYVNYIRTDLKRRALHAALLNRSKWQEGRDLIASFPEKGEPAAGDAAKEGELCK
jgi:hypothetical protein